MVADASNSHRPKGKRDRDGVMELRGLLLTVARDPSDHLLSGLYLQTMLCRCMVYAGSLGCVVPRSGPALLQDVCFLFFFVCVCDITHARPLPDVHPSPVLCARLKACVVWMLL